MITVTFHQGQTLRFKGPRAEARADEYEVALHGRCMRFENSILITKKTHLKIVQPFVMPQVEKSDFLAPDRRSQPFLGSSTRSE
jgi:hypothetical protein